MWDGFDQPVWAKRKHDRCWWQRLHIYLTGSDPWKDKDDDDPPTGSGGGGYGLDPNTQLAINIAIAGAAGG